ncbi:hypothetical protein OROHE_007149 [Orobanche hederae]
MSSSKTYPNDSILRTIFKFQSRYDRTLKVCRNWPAFSHLFFADDLIFMGKATLANARIIKSVLDRFCGCSGLKLSPAKSEVFFTKTSGASLKRNICEILGFGSTMNLGKYLGVNLNHGRVNQATFSPFFDKIMGRFKNWKSKFLSLSGRATLVQSVTSSIPIHSMQSMWLPENICDKLDKLNRDFLWSSDINQKRLHLVGWNKTTKPKVEGGLGIRDARTTNEALLAKMVWRILCDEKTVWSKLVQNKYLKSANIFQHLSKPGDSPTWNGIILCATLLKPFFRWKIGNGVKTSFWYDNWLGSKALCETVPFISEPDRSLKICDLIDQTGKWNLQELQTQLPLPVKQEILRFQITLNSVEDTPIWNESANGMFSCQSAYKTLKRHYSTGNTRPGRWTWLWKLKCSHKLKHFLWLAIQGRLVTNLLRHTRKISPSAHCPSCDCAQEFVLHLMRYYPQARQIWEDLLPPQALLGFDRIEDANWFRKNLLQGQANCDMLPNIPWFLIFTTATWNIWKTRNSKIFKNTNQSKRQTVFLIRQESLDLATCFYRKGNGPSSFKWSLPPLGWFKLNIDGSIQTHRNLGGIGGLLRDDRGDWMWGFCRKISMPTVDEIELKALLHGLNYAWERRIPQLEVELDSKNVFDLINGTMDCPIYLQDMKEKCKELMSKPWNVRFRHIHRSANGSADFLAKWSYTYTDGGRFLDQPPEDLKPHLASDLV